MFYRVSLITIGLLLIMFPILMFMGCGDEGITIDHRLPLAPAAPTLVTGQNCPAFLYKNTTNMRYVPRGTFTMGGAYDTDEHRTPEWLAHTEAFYMDKHEVTIGEFFLFLEMTDHQLLWSINIPNRNDAEIVDDFNYFSHPVQVSCMMQLRMLNGLANGCRPKLNGRRLHVADSMAMSRSKATFL